MLIVEKLSREEEADLCRRGRAGDRLAREKLIRHNLPLVYHIATNFRGPIPIEDRVQEGAAGMTHAADLFDPDRDVPFGCYAAFWVRQAIGKAIVLQGRDIRLPMEVHLRLRKLDRIENEFLKERGRRPTDRELLEEAHIDAGKCYAQGRYRRAVASLQLTPRHLEPLMRRPWEDGPEASGGRPWRHLLEKRRHETIERALRSLAPRERKVVRWRFGLGRNGPVSFRRIGLAMGISGERARQIMGSALGKLRQDARVADLRPR